MTVSKPQRQWIVQKYGGTSLGKMLARICGEIIPISLQAGKLVVTCSAFSSEEKTNGTTSLLLDCIALAQKPEDSTASAQIATSLNTIVETHVKVLRQDVGPSEGTGLAEIEAEIVRDCSEVQEVLGAARQIREVSPHTQDKILILGEKLAAKVVAFKLRTQGINAEAVLFDSIVEETFGSDFRQQKRAYRELGLNFYHRLACTIGERLAHYVDTVPVVGGFFGMMPEVSVLDCIGRGYSDLCAAMCAQGVQANELQIWKEVDGIFTADPRLVPSAQLLPVVTIQEAAELTFFGSEVIHPLTISQVQHAGIPMRVKNVFQPLGAGTVIIPSEGGMSTPKDSSSASSFEVTDAAANQRIRNRPTALTVKRNIMVANLTCHLHAKPSWFLRTVFDQLERHHVVVDLVSVSEKNISIAVEERNAHALAELANHVTQSGQGAAVVAKDLSIVSVVGRKMRNTVGIAAEMFSALAGAKINIHMISQGASEISIAAVVDAEHAVAAVDVIHAQVLKIPTMAETQNGFMRGPWLY